MSKISTTERIFIEQQVMNKGKDVGTAYLLLVFLGLLGGHNFYLGRIGPGIAQALLTASVFGIPISFIWIIIDAFTIPTVISDKKETIRKELMASASRKTGNSKSDIEATVMLQELKSQQDRKMRPVQYAFAAGIVVMFLSVAFKTLNAPDPTPDEQAMMDEIKSLKGQVRALKNKNRQLGNSGGGLLNLQQERAMVAAICSGSLIEVISLNTDAWIAVRPIISLGGHDIASNLNNFISQSRQLESTMLSACSSVPAGLK